MYINSSYIQEYCEYSQWVVELMLSIQIFIKMGIYSYDFCVDAFSEMVIVSRRHRNMLICSVCEQSCYSCQYLDNCYQTNQMEKEASYFLGNFFSVTQQWQ